MSIDLGNTPVGTAPTTEQQAQIRTAINALSPELNVIDEDISLETYSMPGTYAGKYVRFSSLTDFSMYIELNLDFPLYGVVTFFQKNIGKLTFSPASGVVINSYLDGLSTKGQYSAIQLIKVGTNTWDVLGGTV